VVKFLCKGVNKGVKIGNQSR